jgi:hypothetical protein
MTEAGADGRFKEAIRDENAIIKAAAALGAHLANRNLERDFSGSVDDKFNSLGMRAEDLMAELSEEEQIIALRNASKLAEVDIKDLENWEPTIIEGITLFNPRYHMSCSNYGESKDAGETGVEVIEMPTGRITWAIIKEVQNDSSAKPIEERIKEVLESLEEREQTILKLRFGLEDGTRHPIEKIAQALGTTSEYVLKVVTEAPAKSRKHKMGVFVRRISPNEREARIEAYHQMSPGAYLKAHILSLGEGGE